VANPLQKHHFLLRRLHSLTGILPIGLFVIMHLFTNAQLALVHVTGWDVFQHEVDFIHSIPGLLFIEIALWLSIGFHAALGVAYMVGWAPNPGSYGYLDNWRYTMQRVTAWIALVFILLHIATLRWRIDIFNWSTPFYARIPPHEYPNVPMSTPLTAYALQFHWLVVVFYFVGVSGAIFHWANGLWTAAITWGATVTPASQRRWGYACLGLGVLLAVFMVAAIVGAIEYDLEKDTTAEQRLAMDRVIPAWRELYGLEPVDAAPAAAPAPDAAYDPQLEPGEAEEPPALRPQTPEVIGDVEGAATLEGAGAATDPESPEADSPETDVEALLQGLETEGETDPTDIDPGR
jgi:succinate dehydrogenase / fumarate reductase cytochrome b subunit